MLQRLSAPAAGLLVGLAVGLIDLIILIAHPRSCGIARAALREDRRRRAGARHERRGHRRSLRRAGIEPRDSGVALSPARSRPAPSRHRQLRDGWTVQRRGLLLHRRPVPHIRWENGREALFERGGSEVPLASQPEWVNVARDAVSRAREVRREANEFDALGYLQ